MKTLSLLSTASLNQPEFPGRYVRPERANCEDETIIKKLILSNKILFIKNLRNFYALVQTKFSKEKIQIF